MAGRIEVVSGDITSLHVDAIVNAANTWMLGGGGVDGAIHAAAGDELLRACEAIPEVSSGVRCPVGQCKITPGFQLPAAHVIHAVGPRWRNDGSEDALLERCYRGAMQLATEHQITSIAFPAISCGAFAFPPERATEIAVRTIRDCLRTGSTVERVLLVAFDQMMADCFRLELSRA